MAMHEISTSFSEICSFDLRQLICEEGSKSQGCEKILKKHLDISKKIVFLPTESCQSGRMGQTRNLLTPPGVQGFESLTFRKAKELNEKSLSSFVITGVGINVLLLGEI